VTTTLPDVRHQQAAAPGRLLWIGLLAVALLGMAMVCGVAAALDRFGRTPREWAPYLERRALHHNPVIIGSVDLVSGWLRDADILPHVAAAIDWAGAAADRAPVAEQPVAPGRRWLVGSLARLREAVGRAQPGDVIELLPGTYRLDYPALHMLANGTARAPIALRAARLGDVVIESNTLEAFKVHGAYWIFENLAMRGVCDDDAGCEHALHVVGGAAHVVIRNNRLSDFNAQIKVNGEDGRTPDDGLVEDNTLDDSRPRHTENPVTPVDLDAASRWRVTGNLIADFIKTDGNRVSYGAFAKAAGDHTLFNRNVVLCEYRLRGYPGARVGLSFGGGGSDPGIRRDGDISGREQAASTMRDNLVAFCSDVGIYLNQAAATVLDHNTLIDTAGIDARFADTSAEVTDNIVDGAIRARDGGTLRAAGNLASPLLGLFLGWHPARALFSDPGRLDLLWRSAPAPRAVTPVSATPGDTDLCGIPRGAAVRPGAFDDFAGCLRGAPAG
jgi:hypothetical protein